MILWLNKSVLTSAFLNICLGNLKIKCYINAFTLILLLET